jgi:transposase
MQLHANAALSLNGRRRMVVAVLERGRSITEAAEAAGVSDRTCSKWVGRYHAEGEAGLRDRSSAPRRVANRTDAQTVQVIVALRRLRFTGPEIAELLNRPLSTVSAVLKRCGMGKLGRLGLEPAQRYERERPGELVRIAPPHSHPPSTPTIASEDTAPSQDTHHSSASTTSLGQTASARRRRPCLLARRAGRSGC